MSIPAQTNTTDYQVYLRKYLDSLTLQNELNIKNFSANVEYQKTGIQQAEVADTRSIEERMADIEKLKVQARAMLNKITDVTNTNEIMSYLIQNPKILFYFIQNFISIEEIVKRQFSMGILAPQMISLLYKKYIQYNNEVLIPDSKDFDLVSSLLTKEDAIKIKNVSADYELEEDIDALLPSLPSRADISKFTSNPERYVKEIKGFANKYRDGFTIDDGNELIDAYNDPVISGETAARINGLENELKTKIAAYLGVTPPKYTPIKEKPLPEKPKRINQPQELTPLLTPQEKVEIRQKRARRTAAEMLIARQQEAQARAEKAATKASTQASKEQAIMAARTKRVEAQQKAEAKAATNTATEATPDTDEPEEEQFGSGLGNREKHIHRFKVLKGEVVAGNTSPAVFKELRSLVVKMVKLSELDKSQAMMILKELN
jgi:hypothetical protein